MNAEAGMEMPRYRSHKTVWALKIAAIVNAPPDAPLGSSALEVVDKGYAPVTVSAEYMAKHLPKAGGYYVVYADGYKSFSPAEAFEAGNTRIGESDGIVVGRKVESHKVNPANDTIEITVTDAPGAGGANHRYQLDGIKFAGNRSRMSHDVHSTAAVLFQNGPIPENGVNGVTQEVLIAICIDRLECFQRGPYASNDNQAALEFLRGAQDALHRRTKERMARSVEGTHTV